MSVRNYSVTQILPAFDDVFSEITEELRSVLSDRSEYEVSFELHDVSVCVANGFRRTALDELVVSSLEVGDIQTNAEFIISDELRDRVALIPIRQDIPEDAVFSVAVVNGDKSMNKNVMSKDLVGPHADCVPSGFRIAELKHGKYLKIPRITVSRGIGRDNARYSLTGDYEYDNMDYMDVHMINAKGLRHTARVLVADVAAAAPKLKNVKHARVLIIPNNTWALAPHEQARADKYPYDAIVHAPIEERSSLRDVSRSFVMKFYLPNAHAPRNFAHDVCDNIITRLRKVLEYLSDKKYSTHVRETPLGVHEVWELLVPGETHTIGEILLHYMYDADPSIPYIIKHMSHPNSSDVSIRAIHAEPARLCELAVNAAIETFESLKKQFDS